MKNLSDAHRGLDLRYKHRFQPGTLHLLPRVPDLLPTVKLGKHDVTRLIIGGNPISGNSHQNRELDHEMRDYYTMEKIKETLRQCEDAGINTWQSRGDNFIVRALNEHRLDGGNLQWVAQTASERRDTISNIHQISEYNPIAIYHHGSRTDHYYRRGTFEEVERAVDEIRSLGTTAGVGTHMPEVVAHCEEIGLDPDFYLLSVYNLTERGEGYDPEDRVKATEMIRKVRKPFLLIKVMAAGRNEPNEAFRFLFRNIKPTDAAVVGMYTKHQPQQVYENVRIVNSLLGGS